MTSEILGRAAPAPAPDASADGSTGLRPGATDASAAIEPVTGTETGGLPGAVDEPRRRASVTFDGVPFPIRPHHCFACGTLNVDGLGLALHVEGDACWTEVVLPDRFAGWQGIAHGGIVCTILDEVMAWSLVAGDHWALTARMNVEFKRPVPIGRSIRAEGRLTSIRRRLLETSARLVDAGSGELLATAEALYVAAPHDRKAELKRRYGFEIDQVPGRAVSSGTTGSDTTGSGA